MRVANLRSFHSCRTSYTWREVQSSSKLASFPSLSSPFSLLFPFSTPLHQTHHQQQPTKMQRSTPPSFQFTKFLANGYRIRRGFCSGDRQSQSQSHFTDAAAGAMAAHLKSRSVIRFRGPDAVKFLHGLLTNDVRRFGESPCEKTSSLPTPNLAPVSVPPMYAAMLTPQGRFLYDLFLYRPPRPGEKLDRTGSGPGPASDEPVELLADVDSSVLDELLQTLNKYRLRSKVDIENVAEDFSCWQRFGKNLSRKASSAEEPEAASVGWGAGVDPTAMSASRGEDIGWQWFRDPRLECLGFRGIFPSNRTPPLIEADKETDEDNYVLWRLEKGVAEGSTEILKVEAIPLEYNLVGLNAISFDKGCYVGQELVARTHHRGVIRKRVVPLKFLNDRGEDVEQKVSPGSEVIHSASSKKAGRVIAALGCRGLGLLRLEEVFRGSQGLAIQGLEGVRVEAIRPDWWPAKWLEHQQHNTSAA